MAKAAFGLVGNEDTLYRGAQFIATFEQSANQVLVQGYVLQLGILCRVGRSYAGEVENYFRESYTLEFRVGLQLRRIYSVHNFYPVKLLQFLNRLLNREFTVSIVELCLGEIGRGIQSELR